MKMTKDIKKILLAGCVACSFSALVLSCADKLDEVPDNRTEIDTPEKVRKLLTSGYPQSTPAVICELSGDNLVDDNVVINATHNDPYYDFHEEVYKWKDIKNYSIGNDDTPYQIWEQYYQGVSVCNHAIEAMREMSSNPAADPNLSYSWGEAHVLRAYLHFMLVNIFAESYKNATLSAQDRGIPYVTATEEVVHVDYSSSAYLHNVKETYDLIEKDLLEGVELINDSKFEVPAYHFNKNAAYAFAARFYLFKRDYEKCIEYADKALGSNPTSVLRKWSAISKNTLAAAVNDYNDEKAVCNFMIQSTYSLQWRMLVDNARFAINTGAKFKSNGKTWTVPSTLDITIWGTGPNWSSTPLPAFTSRVYVNRDGQQYGCWFFRLYEYFEYTDKIAGIGYVHMLYHPFTAEETLLCRAEAKLYKGDRDGAIKDLDYWTSSHLVNKTLNLNDIKSKYNRDKSDNIYVSELHPQEMGFEKVLTGDDLAVLDCVLHFRRIETIHEGDRWFDIKRYGITVYHHYRGAREDEIHTDILNYNDPRRVIQLPQNVLDAGYPASRETGSSGGSSSGSNVWVNQSEAIHATYTLYNN